MTDVLGTIQIHLNVFVILVLLGIGFAIKHTKVLEKVLNGFIPVILMLLGVAVYVAVEGVGGGGIGLAIANGIFNGCIAVAIHSSGKNIFYVIAEKIGDIFPEDRDSD